MSVMLKEIESVQQELERAEKARKDRERREREYRYMVASKCFDAIRYAAEAGGAPGVAMPDLKEAARALREAQHYAELLEDMSK